MEEKGLGKPIGSKKHILLFLCFIPVRILYFLSQHLTVERTVIHASVDDIIPFVPVFIIPYFVWYAYVPLLMVWACFTDKLLFKKQCLKLFSGVFIGIAVFIVFPTAIDFRPTVEGSDIFSKMCAWIYSNDRPVNVLPSLHCYEACCIHMATFCGTSFSKKKIARIISAVIMVLICLSTVFVKQHSAVDLVCGCAMAVAVNSVVNGISKK